MATTSIEWTNTINPDGSVTRGMVWNPTSGCTKVSQGCKNCYAERIANRFWGERKFCEVQCHPERLEQPLHWKKPRVVFVDSMSDLFHPDVPDEFIDLVFEYMALAKHHTFMILTKRPKRMSEWFNQIVGAGWEKKHILFQERVNIIRDLHGKPFYHLHNDWPLPNVWLGVSVENQPSADERIPYLLQTPAAHRFVSYEPAISPVRFSEVPGLNKIGNSPGLDLVIMGCENGPREMDINWARSMRDQCVSAGVDFYLKQMVINGKLVKMPELDGHVWDQLP